MGMGGGPRFSVGLKIRWVPKVLFLWLKGHVPWVKICVPSDVFGE